MSSHQNLSHVIVRRAIGPPSDRTSAEIATAAAENATATYTTGLSYPLFRTSVTLSEPPASTILRENYAHPQRTMAQSACAPRPSGARNSPRSRRSATTRQAGDSFSQRRIAADGNHD